MAERQVNVLAIRANRIVGWVLVGAGIFGFIHSLPGLMELTVLHNVLHLGTGAAALLSTGSEAAAVATARLLGFAYLGLAVLGLVAPYIFPNHLPLTPFDTRPVGVPTGPPYRCGCPYLAAFSSRNSRMISLSGRPSCSRRCLTSTCVAHHLPLTR